MNENIPLISIIVPMYNAAEYIEDCLSSLISQEYTKIEILVIDDGSTDTSVSVVNNFISTYQEHRIHLHTQTNAGAPAARNSGINLTNPDAKLLFFVDADDRVAPDYVSLLASLFCGDNLVCGKLYRCRRNDTTQAVDNPIIHNFDSIWSNTDFMKEICNGIINSSCCKCYDLEVIRKHHIRFPMSFPEDTFFNIEYLKHVNKFTLADTLLYYYIVTPNSITSQPNRSVFDNYISLQSRLYKFVSKGFQKYIDSFVYPQYRSLTVRFLKNGNYEVPTVYRKKSAVKKAFRSYKPKTPGDYIAHYCLYFGWYGLYKYLFIK